MWVGGDELRPCGDGALTGEDEAEFEGGREPHARSGGIDRSGGHDEHLADVALKAAGAASESADHGRRRLPRRQEPQHSDGARGPVAPRRRVPAVRRLHVGQGPASAPHHAHHGLWPHMDFRT